MGGVDPVCVAYGRRSARVTGDEPICARGIRVPPRVLLATDGALGQPAISVVGELVQLQSALYSGTSPGRGDPGVHICATWRPPVWRAPSPDLGAQLIRWARASSYRPGVRARGLGVYVWLRFVVTGGRYAGIRILTDTRFDGRSAWNAVSILRAGCVPCWASRISLVDWASDHAEPDSRAGGRYTASR